MTAGLADGFPCVFSFVLLMVGLFYVSESGCNVHEVARLCCPASIKRCSKLLRQHIVALCNINKADLQLHSSAELRKLLLTNRRVGHRS